jgi:hypothetical protein
MLMPSDMSVQRRIDQAFWNRAQWDLKFAWRPKRCEFSGQWIWFKLAYRGTAVYTGPGQAVYEYRWTTREEYLVAKLKGIV